MADYASDYDAAEFAWAGFAELLKTLENEAGLKKVHIIAHSMGNRVVLGALAHMPETVSVGELIFAAPDVDTEVFRRYLQAVSPEAKGITLYASANDKALVVSRTIRSGFSRAPEMRDSEVGHW